jgi:hypothetical protein
MGTDAYALVDGNNEVIDIIMADDIETAKHFLGEKAIKIEDWAEVGWIHNPETKLFSRKPE